MEKRRNIFNLIVCVAIWLSLQGAHAQLALGFAFLVFSGCVVHTAFHPLVWESWGFDKGSILQLNETSFNCALAFSMLLIPLMILS